MVMVVPLVKSESENFRVSYMNVVVWICVCQTFSLGRDLLSSSDGVCERFCDLHTNVNTQWDTTRIILWYSVHCHPKHWIRHC